MIVTTQAEATTLLPTPTEAPVRPLPVGAVPPLDQETVEAILADCRVAPAQYLRETRLTGGGE